MSNSHWVISVGLKDSCCTILSVLQSINYIYFIYSMGFPEVQTWRSVHFTIWEFPTLHTPERGCAYTTGIPSMHRGHTSEKILR